jgi:hypothetical protein
MFFGVEFYDFGIEMFFHKSHIYEVLLAFYKLIQVDGGMIFGVQYSTFELKCFITKLTFISFFLPPTNPFMFV